MFFGSWALKSNDTAIRLIRHYWALKGEPKRRIIISRRHASRLDHRGWLPWAACRTCMSTAIRFMRASVTSSIPIGSAKPRDGESLDEFGLRAAKALEDEILALGPENVAAFAAEPVQGAGGVKIAPDTYWPAVQKIIDKYGILFLADEVITGFGRVGAWFASEHYGIRPNLITFAKAATSGYIPLSGLLIDDRIVAALMRAQRRLQPRLHLLGSPVAFAVALKNIEIMEREKLVPRVKEYTGPALAKMLAKFKDHPLVGEVRSVGLLGAIELVADKRTRRRLPTILAASASLPRPLPRRFHHARRVRHHGHGAAADLQRRAVPRKRKPSSAAASTRPFQMSREKLRHEPSDRRHTQLHQGHRRPHVDADGRRFRLSQVAE